MLLRLISSQLLPSKISSIVSAALSMLKSPDELISPAPSLTTIVRSECLALRDQSFALCSAHSNRKRADVPGRMRGRDLTAESSA